MKVEVFREPGEFPFRYRVQASDGYRLLCLTKRGALRAARRYAMAPVKIWSSEEEQQ